MSAVDPGIPQGGPNPLELFFEKNKKWIYALAVVLVATLASKYGLEKLERAKLNQQWREFTAATGISRAFAESVALTQLPPEYQKYAGQIWGSQLQGKQRELVTGLVKDVKTANLAAIETQITACAGDPTRLPWLLWVAANKHYAQGEWDQCVARCEELKSRFGDHVLTKSSKYPIQVREEKKDPEAKKKKTDDEASPKPKKPDLEPAVPGSPVENLLAAVAKDREFEAANPHFFKAPEPDKGETAVLTISGVNLTGNVEIEIAFYGKAAPNHVAAFKKAIAGGHYDGMRIHKVKRKPKDPNRRQGDRATPTTIHLGHPNSKSEDRSKWKEEVKAKDEEIIAFESGMKDLSFFPFMVAAEQEKEGKSSALRFFVCENDCASDFDGEYVIFGRVIRGMEHITDIANRDMADVAEDNAGEGRPAADLKIEKTEIKK